MFIESEITWTIAVKPSELKSGLHIKRALLRKLLADFDKLKCSEKHGYYICVTTLEGIGEGKIWEGKGCIAYKVQFRCLTYKPQKYEKVFAVVTGEPQEKGVICSFGPMENMFLTAKLMKDQYTFVGASETKQAHFKGKDGSVIENGSVLRVEIIGVKFNSLGRTFDTVCSVSRHYLGIERRTWEDKSKPQAAAASEGGDWGTKLDANENEAGGWGSHTHAENGGGGWGAIPVKENGGWDTTPAKSDGGWGDVTAKKADSGGGWDTSPVEKAGKGGGWDADAAAESAGGWDSAPTKKADSNGRWGAAPVEKSSDEGGWGEVSPQKEYGGRNTPASGKKSKGTMDSKACTVPETGGWGSSPAKKSKVEESGDPASKTNCGAWGNDEVENTGGGWGD